MSAPIKVIDLVQKSLDALDAANKAEGEDAIRHERKARIYEGLASAQSAKTANVIAYLNSDHDLWNPTDHQAVRIMLGLHDIAGIADEGGEAAQVEADEPIEPAAPAAAPEQPSVVTESEPSVEEPSFA